MVMILYGCRAVVQQWKTITVGVGVRRGNEVVIRRRISLKQILEARTLFFDDLEGDFTTKNHLEIRQESFDRKGKGKMVVFEDETKDDLTETLASESKSVASKGEALSGEPFNPLHESKSTTSKQEASVVRDVGCCFGDELVGHRVKVWWPLDQMFYEGEITFFDQLNKRHKVTYDDGEIESLDLLEECWLVVDDI